MGADFRLAVVEPVGGVDWHPGAYPDFAGAPSRDHPPAEVCAFAACTAGTYHGCRRSRTVPEGTTAVLLMLEKLRGCLRVLRQLQRAGNTVAVTFSEAGTMQIAELLNKPAALRRFYVICQQADGAIAATPEGVPVFRGAGVRHVEFIPTPCPVDDPRWDVSAPADQRHGILIGTSGFRTNYRNHLAALLSVRQLAESLQEPVTVVLDQMQDDQQMGDRLRALWPHGLLRVVDGPLPFLQFLRLMATHKLVFQLDQAGAAGQIAAYALLCRIPCVGGYGNSERLVFPDLCGFGRTTEELVDAARRLVVDPAEREAAVTKALALAEQSISFGAVRARLADFFGRVSDGVSPAGPAPASSAAAPPRSN